ncbi:MAG TPA: FeoB-associated Cys-rich membrane protein [Bacillota bacterium]|nr:FeoB-associated Cys-rich membrane protein [Bacillota bacterium]
MAPYIIGALIGAYLGYLIYRQVKNIKEKNYCGSCAGCPSAQSCGQIKEANGKEAPTS